MTTIEQLPQKIDSNVTINPPRKIEINHVANLGWCIKMDGVHVTEHTFTGVRTRYWEDASGPMDYLIERHLVVTKAYRELEKAVKKVHNKSSKAKS